jgi:hypothetical protein
MTIPALILALGSAQLPAQEDGDGSRRRREGMRERMMRDDNAPKVGDVAPVFTIKSLDGKSETNLASFKGKKPVLLFFGSYT